MKLQVFLLLLLHSFVLIRTAAIHENGVEELDEDGDIDKKKCPPWDKWQASKCLWPSQEFSSLPKACTALPKKPEIPDILKQFVQSKQLEVWSLVQGLFNLRGAKAACGYCSRKIRCRQRKGGEWTKGCKFEQVQMVDEECDGTKACEISAVLGACPPPVPMPRPRKRKPDQLETDSDDRLQKIDTDLLGDKNMEIEVGKNSTQGPPLWHCVRNKDGSKCLCCCGWYFPDAKSGKCKNIRPDGADDEDQSWNWSGLVDSGLQYPFGFDGAVGDSLPEQIEAPPMDVIVPPSVDTDDQDQGEVIDQMRNPLPIDSTADQVAAPVTAEGKKVEKKVLHETNEI